MPRSGTARLFVAVDPPVEVCEELAAWARAAAAGLDTGGGSRGAARLRLLAPEGLHLTVCFLGARPVQEIEAIGAALSSCAVYVGELRAGAPVWLPPRRPRALAVEVHDEGGGELSALHASVGSAVSAVSGWTPERRRFRAHITLARVGARFAAERRASGLEPGLPATPRLAFAPEAIVLYRSWLSPAGATYEPLASCSLVPGEP
jgi:2'-5' RNA ligase